MDLHSEGDNFSHLKTTTNARGERCVESPVPLVGITIQETSKNIEKAFNLFFESFSNVIEGYIKDKPDLSAALLKRIEELEEEKRKEIDERRKKYRNPSEEERIQNDITAAKFNEELDLAIMRLSQAFSTVSSVIDEDPARLYVKIVGLDGYDEKSTERITFELEESVRKELKQQNSIVLLTKCRVLFDRAIIIAIKENI